MSVRSALEAARKAGRTAFIPYITAGDPDLSSTALFVKALADCGADAIELGVPFSDPVADGPTNQLAATRALASGTTLEGVLELTARLRADGVRVPVILFTYLNPVFRMGYEAFAKRARAAKADAALVVDLPPEEAGDYMKAMRAAGLETVFLASPTTAPDRLSIIDSSSTGFIYYVSRTGVTGARATLTSSVEAELDRLRAAVRNPVAVGFGISTPEHARALAKHADGVVVGSALVKIIEKTTAARGGGGGVAAAELEIRQLASSIVKELKRGT